MPCVHCGFCLSVCPTYTRLGDERDSPRGRLHLMRAVTEGRLSPGSEAFRSHIDRCLGCRACEPVCPSGVEYGALLELARAAAAAHHPPPPASRALLAVFGSQAGRRVFLAGGKLLRGTRLAAVGARILPAVGPLAGAKLGLAMLAASGPPGRLPGGDATRGRGSTAADTGSSVSAPAASAGSASDVPLPGSRGRVALLRGCVQEGLYARVNEATLRVLRVNGFDVVEAPGQDCCGALHAHGGDRTTARHLAATNVSAFGAAAVDYVVVNAAGCGAAMKEYTHLLEDDREAREVAGRVRDALELLAEAGPVRGGEIRGRAAVDHPCHLLHAQGIRSAPLRVLAAIPGLEVEEIDGAEECCGGAGIYGLTHPDLGGWIGTDKVRAVMASEAEVLTTPNPGCLMQIGAGLRLAGSSMSVAHPIELLDESYRRAGFYERAWGGEETGP